MGKETISLREIVKLFNKLLKDARIEEFEESQEVQIAAKRWLWITFKESFV